MGYTITPFASGATNPTLTTLLANLGVQLFDYIDLPYTDTTSLNALETFLSDASGRWAAETMLYGHVFSAYRGTFSARTTFGTGRNDQHATILGFYDSPTPAWLEASDWCAAHVIRLRVNPAQGLATQPLNLLPPPIASQDTAGGAQHPAVRRHEHVHGGCGRGLPDRPLDHHLSEQCAAASRTIRI